MASDDEQHLQDEKGKKPRKEKTNGGSGKTKKFLVKKKRPRDGANVDKEKAIRKAKAKVARTKSQERLANLPKPSLNGDYQTVEQQKCDGYTVLESSELDDVTSEVTRSYFTDDVDNQRAQQFIEEHSTQFEDQSSYQTDQTDQWDQQSDQTDQTDQMSNSGRKWKKGEVFMTPQMMHALKMSQVQSQVKYHEGFQRAKSAGYTEVSSTPEFERLRKQKALSNVEYQRAMNELRGRYNLDDCLSTLPEVKNAKRATHFASKNAYREGLDEVLEKYKGFQKLPFMDYHDVQRSVKAAAISDKRYKEDWEYDRSVVCFPATLTPGYVRLVEAQRNASTNVYKDGLESTLENVHFDPTKTDLYKTIQDNLKYVSSKEYKADYEENKAHYHPLALTAEMMRSKAMQGITNWTAYTAYARKLWEHYHLVVPVPIITQAIQTAKMTSDKWYKADYHRECVGKSGPANIANYPLLQQARKAAGQASQIEYRREADKFKSHYTMPVDSPDILRAKSAAEKSDIKYKKQKFQTVADFQGFQRMDPRHHPVVQHAAKNAELQSQKAYTEDWEYDKQMIYFPAHITPGYEAASDVKHVQSDSAYKKEFEHSKAKNNYDVTSTKQYDDIKSSLTDAKYKEEYLKNRGNVTQVAETSEMLLSKELKPILSKKAYSEKSKEAQKTVHFGPGTQELSHAVDSQKQASSNQYKQEYKHTMVGKPPADPTSAYPEHTLHSKMTKLASKPEYTRDSEKSMHVNQLPVDAPEFIRAKQSALQSSDIEYKKDMSQTVDQYRGYQTLDPQDHPVVQRANQVAGFSSEKAYKEDWEYDKQMIYFPAHITPGYEAASDVKKVQSDVSYKKDFEGTKSKNDFKVTDTDRYKEMKKGDAISSDVKYKEEYERNKGKGQTQVAETSEMVLSKQLRPVQSKNQYEKKSKEMHQNLSVHADGQEIAHAVTSQRLASPQPYRKEYKEGMVGRGPNDPSQAYPEHELHKKASNLASNADYQKEAAKMMTQHHLPADAPEFIRAKEAAKNASDIEYQKQKQETIANYRGFQTMDGSEHPVVQQGIKAAELASNTLYKEDWEYDKQMIYFPAHITPGYEAASDVKKVQSDVAYKKEFESGKAKNEFRPTDTERYREMKKNDAVSSDVKYREEFLKNKGKGAQVAETPEMILSKELGPVQSKQRYEKESKQMHKNVNIGPDVQNISHSIAAQKLSSDHPYTAEYRKGVVGQGRTDPANSYPEVQRHKELNKNASPAEYHKEAEKMMHTHNLPLDYPEFVRARETAKNASDRHYQKQRKEVIDSYKGFQTMDSKDHPIVQHGIKSAELISNTLYTEDWEYDKQMIYFPAHITPGYEAASDVKKVQSDAAYKGEFEKNKDKNTFKVTDTEAYKSMKETEKSSSEVKYREDYEKNRGKGLLPLAESNEMTRSKELRPVQSNKMYSEKSKEMHKNVNVGSDVQNIAHAVSAQKVASDQPYHQDYVDTMVGKGPVDPAKSYPEYDRLREVNKIISVPEYHKEAEKMMHTHNLPLDYPEFVRARETAKNASDRHYQKQRKEVIDSYKGFQTMDSKDHPIVQHGIKSAELISNALYTEDWEYDKQMIYFPAHITPGYEAASDVKKVQSDAAYKGEFEKNKDKNTFKVTDTEAYKSMKETEKSSSEVKYREEFLKNKGKGAQVAETPEMILSKELGPVQSKQRYERESKQMHKNVNIGPDVQEIARAVESQKLSSDQSYRSEYEKTMVGRPPADMTNSYPEYDHLRKVSKQSSKAEYQKEAEKILHTHNLPLDYPEFVRAKVTAKNASDRHYQKQRKEVIDSYKGFQTMDSKDHPVVQQGIKAAELASGTLYKEDWEYDKQMIYFPAHITPGYEAASDVKKVQSDVAYKDEYEKNKERNNFLMTDTERYKAIKEGEKTASEVKYREEFLKNKGKGAQVAETPEMILSKELGPVQSKQRYEKESKQMHKTVNIGPDVQGISHALGSQKLASEQAYHADYAQEMVGKAPADVTTAYPEYERLRDVSKLNSKALYVKEADKMMHTHNLPLDYPEFVRARETAKNASDRHYQKQRKEVIDSYKGFQTMDSKDHPVVQQGIKAAELASGRLYTEDWEYEKSMIYYPVHITPGYEQAIEASKCQSKVGYSKEAGKSNERNEFKVTDTEQYQAARNLLSLVSGSNYTAEHLASRGQGMHPISETPEMALSNQVKPLLSNKAYTREAKRVMQKYNLDSSTQNIAHALITQKTFSLQEYVGDFKRNVVGKAPSDLANSYPEYTLARNVSNMSSKKAYVKEADKLMHTHNIPLDYPEFVRAKQNAKNASDAEYTKQKNEVINQYRGFQTMDSKDHPIVQQGIKAAELVSNALYKEDWEYDKQMIYFPAHITPGYEAAVQASKSQSDVSYKKQHLAGTGANNFKVTDTEQYKSSKELTDVLSDKKYKEAYELEKGSNRVQVKETAEMRISKSVAPFLSHKIYGDEARRKMQEYNLDSSMQAIAQALSVQKMTSQSRYLDDFKRNVIGKAPSDVTNSYPEYDLARKVSKQTSKALYVKEADKMMHTHNLPLDYPEFVRAKQNAKNASDAEYQKQRNEVISTYRGFQTMDSKEHPVVQHGIRVADIISDRKYKEDYLDERDLIYYPVHLTPGYEAAVKSSENQSEVMYRSRHAKEGGGNHYLFTDTEAYKTTKGLDDLKDHTYKGEYRDFQAMERTPEMEASAMLKNILSNVAYTKEAKKRLDAYNIDLQDQRLSQAMHASQLGSDLAYRRHFAEKVKGQAPNDVTIAHPEYDHARKVSQLMSRNEYVKAAEKGKHRHHLPVDYPEFVRARECAKNASDAEYQKQKKQVIANYRGFQTMDSQDHPVVQRGIKAADLISHHKYIEDYMIDRSIIYYPVHLTPGYEAATKASQYQSELKYKDGQKQALKNFNFDPTKTDAYKTAKETQGIVQEHAYKEDSKKKLETDFTPLTRTYEMEVGDQMRALAPSEYQKRAKKLMHKYHLNVELPEITHAICMSQVLSKNNYLKDYNEKVKGSAPQDLANSYPEYIHARNVTKQTSKKEYTKTGDEIRHQFSLPVDTPELNRAKQSAKIASDMLYKKQRKEVIDSYKGFQTMDSKDHPVVQQGIKAADLMSERKYKEDYMDERDMIYFPVHLTAGYEAAVKSSENQSETAYKAKHLKEKQSNRFNPVQTDQYEAGKERAETMQDKNYKKGLERLSSEMTAVSDSVESQHLRSMRELLSNKTYTEDAKKSLDKYNLNADVIQIAHALATAPLSSDVIYRRRFNDEMKGRGVSGAGVEFYPDHIKAIDNTKMASQSEYKKENEKLVHHYTMPLDTPELNRAKESAINASDLLYKRQKQETIANYRGFQTMDSKDHPVVQQGIKAAELMSERKYKEDYMEDRNLIYYPVHLTAGYEAAVKASQYINGPSYQKAYHRDRNDVHYDVTKTDTYKAQKDLEKLSDALYKTDPSSLRFTQVPDDVDMTRARMVKPLVSYWFYKDQAKKMLDKYHVDVADQRLVHALHSNQLASDIKYRRQWAEEVKGRMGNENMDSYPGYKHAIAVGKNVSQTEYAKGVEKHRNDYTIPADMPSIKHAKAVDGMISNVVYGKSRKDTIENFRGFQTMDSKNHPVVQRGIKAADLISERKYKADYMEDRNLIYYPVHLTAGYEAAVKSSKFASDADYKSWYNRNIRGRGNFPVNLTPGYEQSQQVKPYISDTLYKAKYEKTKSEFTPVVDANDMQHIKFVQPWLSQSKYKKQAREVMGKYHLDVEVPEIAHALYTSSMFSPAAYKRKFEKEIRGVGASNFEKSPFIKQPLKASKLLSKSEYTKKAEEGKQQYTLGLETSDIQQAMIADKLTSDVEYKKGGKEATAACQAFQKMSAQDIPSYKKFRDVAANNSDVKYREEYNDMKKYVYFPYHITPEYESKADSNKALSQQTYGKSGRDNLPHQNFLYHEIPAYVVNKELQGIMSVRTVQKQKQEMQDRGYKISNQDFHNEHVREVQKRVSNNLYKAAAREVMDKYNITAELPEIRQALQTTKLVSDNVYKEEHRSEKGSGMTYNPDIPSFKLARDVKALASENIYKDEASKALHQYSVVADAPDLLHAKVVAQQQSGVEYKRKGKEDSAKCRAYQFLLASEQRDVAHARKVNDIISPAKYREEYNEIRNIIYFPVHLTDGYESAVKANKFASAANYKQNWMKNRYRNNYKVHETEGYKLDRAIQNKISNIAYKAEYRANLGKCPYVTETMERAHQRDMKELSSEKRYRQSAHEIMDKYHLITDEPRMVNAIQAMKLQSAKKYREDYEAGKTKIVTDILQTPSVQLALNSSKLTSEIPYKEAALKDLPKVHIPEDATSIKHAQEVGKLTSEITYKKDAKENAMQGYKKVAMKDHFTLNRLDEIKDLSSEVNYKRDLYEQRGQSIPVVDTPENTRVQKVQKLQSDKTYKKDLEKLVKGHGLTTDVTPQLKHAKEMVALQSEQKYKEGTKDQHEWKSHEAINTPTAVKAREAHDLTSDFKYKENYEKEKGQGCNVITPAISHATDIGKIVSENAYKEKHKEDSAVPPAYTVMPSTLGTEHVQAVGDKISERKYREEHLKEDIGRPSELKDSVQIQQDKKTTELQSNIEYKKQGEIEAEKQRAYLKCLNETPQAIHAKKVRDILSDFKYKEAYETDKGILFYPYSLTPQYETQVKAGKLQSQNVYTKKADKERHNFHLTTDQPNFKQAKEATDIFSDLKYRQPHQGRPPKFRDAKDVPSILHSKKMQDLFSKKRYRSEYEQIKDRYHLDVTTPSIENAKRADKILSDVTYKEAHNKEKGQGLTAYQDSLQMKHLRTLPDQLSDIKYKQDLVLSRGKVIQVSDTPWLQSSKRAQRFISHIKYGKDSGRKLKCRFQPEKFNKHVKNVTESISDSKYRDDYETFFRGNLIPLPETPETRHALKNSKLLSQSEYQQKARDGMKTYLVIPDDPEFKRLREAAGYHSDVTYKGEAVKQQKNFTSVAETPALLKAKESQELQSESAYKGEAKKKLATEYRLPVEGTTVMQQQQHASTLTSDNTYKQKGEQVKHDPTAFKNLKETRDTKHAKKIAASQSEIQYKKSAKQGLQNIHPSAEDPWMIKAMETNTNISDIKYKAKDKDLAHKYKIRGTDNFIKHAMSVRDKISDAKYKESYLDSVGLCWCLPDEKGFQHARKVADLYSDNKYKEEAKKLKGKYHITTDTPEFERLKRVQDGVSESKYKEGADERSKEFTILESTPDIKHATNVSSLVSKNKYKAAHEKSKGSYTLIEKDPSIQHAVNVNNMQSQNSYKKKAHDMQKDGFTVLAKRRDTEHQQKVQMNVSNVQYRKEARENVDKDFTVVEKRPDVQHAVNTAKMQSNIHYKQKLDGKNLEMMKTPGMKCALDANKLQSNLEYRKEFDNEIKGKGWKFIKDTPAQKHAENIGKVQSQFNYTKKHRDNIGKGFTTVTDRPDIVHATSRNEQVSDYEYKRRHRDMTGKGYTFTPDNPSQVHAEEASNFQSELKYRRKYGNTGKSWQADDSPFIGHYKEAQKLVDNIDYRKSAREINARGTSAASEDTPASLHYKKAQEILDDRRYKADYEKTVRGRGMTFDLHGTPSMDHVRRAEDIKSEKLYKANYETTMKGRPTAVMDAPQLLNAQNATHLISDAKYKQLHNESRGQMLSMSDTPEMRRVRENQKAISQVSYKAASEELRGKYAAAVMDTPELRRVRQNTKNYSNIAYKDSSAAQSCSVSVLDTPEFRTAKQNTQNFSQIKYQADRANMRGKVTAVADDLTMRRVKQATLISSDLAYKGAKGKVEEMEKMRANVVQENQRKSQRSTANASNVRNAASLNQVRSASANAVHSSGQTVIRSEPMKRWRRNPGSIFDYDPSEYETDTEYEEGKPGRNGAYASDYGQSDADIDYRKLISLDPSTLKGQATPWTDFVLGKEFKHVEAPNSVLNYQNAQTQRQNYTSMPRQKQYRAIYDYAAADDDEIDLRDGDVIVNAQSIDEGWMFGTVLRSGQTGMLPANYVQLVL